MDARKKYWEDNIEKWNGYYNFSHTKEEFEGSLIFRWVYRTFIGPVEALLMKRRYQITSNFLDANVHSKTSFNDLGCGGGVFSILALQKGAKVSAIDFTDAALNLTSEAVNFYGGISSNLQLIKMDLRSDTPPFADVSIAMGVAPYMEDIESFLGRTLSSTNLMMCNFVSPDHMINRVRQKIPYLNVRRLVFHSPEMIETILQKNCFSLKSRIKLGTGFVDVYVRE